MCATFSNPSIAEESFYLYVSKLWKALKVDTIASGILRKLLTFDKKRIIIFKKYFYLLEEVKKQTDIRK